MGKVVVMMDNREMKALMEAAGGTLGSAKESMEDPAIKYIVQHTCKADPFAALCAFNAGKIMQRLDGLLGEDAPEIPPLEEFDGGSIVSLVRDSGPDTDAAVDVYAAVLPYLRAAFRYGYYQALRDGPVK